MHDCVIASVSVSDYLIIADRPARARGDGIGPFAAWGKVDQGRMPRIDKNYHQLEGTGEIFDQERVLPAHHTQDTLFNRQWVGASRHERHGNAT